MANAAFRLSTEDLTPSLVNAGVGKAGRSDWSRVRRLGGEEIVLTVYGSPPGNRQVVRGTVDEFGLTVLNLTGPIPTTVRNKLSDDAGSHPEYFVRAQRGDTVRVNKHVRLAPDGVFLDGRRVAELQQVIQRVARDSVAEISHVHGTTGRGMAWGALIGLGAGAAIIAGQCGANWSESSGCGNLEGIWLFWGTLNRARARRCGRRQL
jgi:hypothetical protein